MRSAVNDPCASCGHSRGKHEGSEGSCRVGWTYLHYAEKRCPCASFTPVVATADAELERSGAT